MPTRPRQPRNVNDPEDWRRHGYAAEQTLVRPDGRADHAPQLIRYILVGMTAGEITLAIDPVPLTQVEKTWRQAGSDRRIVFVP